MSIYQRDTVLKDLRQNVIEVHFTKVNGETRAMRCTLMPEQLPPKYLEEQTAEKEFHRTNTDTIRCWDVQAGGWRSFKIDSVTYMQVVANY
jgi:hypothetical protein